jgi:hypothetical protein
MAESFFWGQGGKKISSRQQAERQRAIADALIGRSGKSASNWGEGLNHIASAITGTVLNDRAATAETEAQDRIAAALAGLSPDSSFQDITGVLADDWASPQQSAIAQALLGQNLQRNDPMYQMGLEKAGLELEALRNPGRPKPIEVGGVLVDPETFQPLFDSRQDDPTSAIQNYQYLISQGVDPALAQQQAFGAPSTTVNVGDQGQRMGTVPAGYAVVEDPSNPSGFRLEPIPGGPVAAAEAASAEQLAAGAAQTERYGNVVTEDIGRALNIIEKDPTFTTGLLGQMLSNIGGTPANRVRNLVDTVKSNVGFDRLQAMRESSPTGGALGSVTERELSLLTSAIGSLEQSNNDADLAYNLKRVNQIYMDIIHGPGNWDPEQKVTPGGEWTDMGDGIRVRPL